jgi:hypothetical protein
MGCCASIEDDIYRSNRLRTTTTCYSSYLPGNPYIVSKKQYKPPQPTHSRNSTLTRPPLSPPILYHPPSPVILPDSSPTFPKITPFRLNPRSDSISPISHSTNDSFSPNTSCLERYEKSVENASIEAKKQDDELENTNL